MKIGGLDKLASQLTGVSRRTLSDYVSGRSEPRISTIVEIADRTGADLDWLLRDRVMNRIAAPEGGSGTFVSLAMEHGFVAIPRLDVRASAGEGRLATFDDTEAQIVAFKEDWLRRLGVNPKTAQIIIAEGDSMAETIGHGDLVLLDRSIDAIIDDGIYVLVYDGMVKLKRIQVLRSGLVLLKSDNPRYETEEVPHHELPGLIVEGRVRWAGGAVG